MKLKKPNNKKILEFSSYFILGVIISFLSYLNRGIFGHEHLLSIQQVFLGYIPFIDFFEHHGPLLYYLLSPLFLFGNYETVSILIIIINSLILTLLIYYICKIFNLNLKKRLILFTTTTWLWVSMWGGALFPEPYIVLILLLIYNIFPKIKHSLKYSIILGFLMGALFLIKFNTFLFLSLGIIIFYLFNYNREKKILSLRNLIYYLIGFIFLLLPFIILYFNNYKEAYYWMFQYNFEYVSFLARGNWPPPFPSMFYLILIVNIITLLIIFLNKRVKNEHYTKTLPIISSIFLLFTVFPLYGISHLLPSLVGFLISLIILFKYTTPFLIKVSRGNLLTKLTLIVLVILISLFSGNAIFSIAKSTFGIFYNLPGRYYHAEFKEKTTKEHVTNECEHIYIYPSNQLMYMALPDNKKIKFVYPNWKWTFQNEMQIKILEEIIKKNVDCILIPSDKDTYLLKRRSAIIEKYIKENYIKEYDFFWSVYSFKNILSARTITDEKYNLLKRIDTIPYLND